MVSSLIYEVLVSIGFSRDLCIADFCLPRCKVTVSEAELNAGKVKIASDDLSPNDHCFIKINHPAESIFVRFDEVKSSYSFSQIMWNVRGREKIEELNSFHLDRHWLEWREIEPLSDDPDLVDSFTGAHRLPKSKSILIELRRDRDDKFNVILAKGAHKNRNAGPS